MQSFANISNDINIAEIHQQIPSMNSNDQLSDHELVDNIFSTSFGVIHAYSYNLLTRQSITFGQTNPQNTISVRLNCPLSWIVNSQKLNNVNIELFKYGVRLRKIFNQKLLGKEELELIDISTQQPSKILPVTQIFLETESEFIKRLSLLGEFIGKKMQTDTSNNEIVIFSIQELHNNDLSIPTLIDAINLHFKDGTAGIHYKKVEGSVCFTAILYNKCVLKPVYDKRIDEFTSEFSSLIRGNKDKTPVRHLCVCAFNKINNDEVFLAASFHADYVTMNQSNKEKILFEISNLVQEYGVILGGDFNKKTDDYSTLYFIEKELSNENINVKMKSTPPGLQLSDTIDAVFLPYSLANNKSNKNVMGYY